MAQVPGQPDRPRPGCGGGAGWGWPGLPALGCVRLHWGRLVYLGSRRRLQAKLPTPLSSQGRSQVSPPPAEAGARAGRRLSSRAQLGTPTRFLPGKGRVAAAATVYSSPATACLDSITGASEWKLPTSRTLRSSRGLR